MTDRLRRGGVSKGQQHRPWTPTLRGRIGHGRSVVYDPDPARLLVEWECDHGRLEGDSSEVCGCFRDEALTRVRVDNHVRHFWLTCACGDKNPPRSRVCVGCGRQLGVIV